MSKVKFKACDPIGSKARQALMEDQLRELSPDTSWNLSRMYFKGWSRNIGNAFLRKPYANEELLISLSNSLKEHELSVRQSRSIPGRLMALLGKPIVQPDEIEIDGTRAKQLFEIARSKPPIPVRISKNYAIHIVEVRSLLETARNNRKPA